MTRRSDFLGAEAGGPLNKSDQTCSGGERSVSVITKTTFGNAVKAKSVLFLTTVSQQFVAHLEARAGQLFQPREEPHCASCLGLHSNTESASQSCTKNGCCFPFPYYNFVKQNSPSFGFDKPPAIACKMRCRRAVMPANCLRIICWKSLPGVPLLAAVPPPTWAAHNVLLHEHGLSCLDRSSLKIV